MIVPKESEIQKLSMFFRLLAGFIFLCSIIATIASGIALAVGEFEIGNVVALLLMVAWSYVTGKIGFTGYPPKYLRFSASAKQ